MDEVATWIVKSAVSNSHAAQDMRWPRGGDVLRGRASEVAGPLHDRISNTGGLSAVMHTHVQVSEFDRGDVTDLAEQLTAICIACGVGDECVDAELCPVDQALNIVDTFLRNGRQITRPTEFTSVIPKDAWFDEKELCGIIDSISEMCLQCTSHVPTCFLNSVYGLLEMAQGVDEPKSPRVAPYLADTSN